MGVLRIRNLTKAYNGRTILDGLSLRVREDEIAVVNGKSGSGKTTLLLCILGFVPPDQGELLLDGVNLGSLPIEKRQLAYVPQDYGLFPHLNVQENIEFGLRVRRVNERIREKKALEVLAAVELPRAFAKRRVTELSGGEKQRVALARALAIQPRLFLLDEPLSAIDPETRRAVAKQLRSIIKRLRIPAIVVSHDPSDARLLGDSIHRLEAGRLQKVAKT